MPTPRYTSPHLPGRLSGKLTDSSLLKMASDRRDTLLKMYANDTKPAATPGRK